MKVVVQRMSSAENSVIGSLSIDGNFQCFTLERLDTLTPAGVYPLTFTTSQRCCDGILWSPDSDPKYKDRCPWADDTHRLLLVNNVPGRSGIRVHAANESSELDGCTATGKGHTDVRVSQSRDALVDVMNKIVPALQTEKATIEYRDIA